MDGATLFVLLVILAALLGGILIALCAIFVVVKKAANEMMRALQAMYDDLRKSRSS